MRYYGIVGSRRRNTLHDRAQVLRLVELLFLRHLGKDEEFTLVSGACPQGADHFAREAAELHEIPIKEFPIDKQGIKNRWEFTQRAHARNRQIAEQSEALFCWIHSDRTGGTENTIKHALELGKKIFLVTDDGSVYLSQDGKIPRCDPALRLLDSSSTG